MENTVDSPLVKTTHKRVSFACYPTPQRKEYLVQMFECSRVVYNDTFSLENSDSVSKEKLSGDSLLQVSTVCNHATSMV